jgi:hypothetical protein
MSDSNFTEKYLYSFSCEGYRIGIILTITDERFILTVSSVGMGDLNTEELYQGYVKDSTDNMRILFVEEMIDMNSARTISFERKNWGYTCLAFKLINLGSKTGVDPYDHVFGGLVAGNGPSFNCYEDDNLNGKYDHLLLVCFTEEYSENDDKFYIKSLQNNTLTLLKC